MDLLPPPEGIYNSKKEALAFLYEHSQLHGYKVSIKSSKGPKTAQIGCTRRNAPISRIPEDQRQRNRRSLGTECPFEVKINSVRRFWPEVKIVVKNGSHNHPAFLRQALDAPGQRKRKHCRLEDQPALQQSQVQQQQQQQASVSQNSKPIQQSQVQQQQQQQQQASVSQNSKPIQQSQVQQQQQQQQASVSQNSKPIQQSQQQQQQASVSQNSKVGVPSLTAEQFAILQRAAQTFNITQSNIVADATAAADAVAARCIAAHCPLPTSAIISVFIDALVESRRKLSKHDNNTTSIPITDGKRAELN